MCRHMYDALRKERTEGKPPQWLVTLREKQDVQRQGGGDRSGATSPAGSRRSARATPSAASAAGSVSRSLAAVSKIEVEKVTYDSSQGIAFRKVKGTKPLEPTTNIFAKPNAKGHHFMQAKWGDGYQSELTTLTVAAWNGRRESAGKPKKSLKLFDEKLGDHGRVVAERKLLDNDNPGVVIKVNGSQKMQLSFKYVPQHDAEANAIAWAKAVVKGKIVNPDYELKAKKAKLEESFGVNSGAKKRPAGTGGGGGALKKRPAAGGGGGDGAPDEAEGGAAVAGDGAEEDDDADDGADESPDDQEADADDAAMGDEAGQEEAAEEEAVEIDEEVDAESDDDAEAQIGKKPAATTVKINRKPAAAKKPAAAVLKKMRKPAVAETEVTESEDPPQLDGPPMTTVFSTWRNSFKD